MMVENESVLVVVSPLPSPSSACTKMYSTNHSTICVRDWAKLELVLGWCFNRKLRVEGRRVLSLRWTRVLQGPGYWRDQGTGGTRVLEGPGYWRDQGTGAFSTVH